MDTKTQIIQFEGKENVAYPDTLGKWTIGVGHCGPEVVCGLVWNDDLVDDTFDLDFNKAWQECLDVGYPWFSQLSEPRQSVLVNMAFQMGEQGGLLNWRPTLDLIASGDFSTAADHIRKSAWDQETHTRAEKLATQLETGIWQS